MIITIVAIKATKNGIKKTPGNKLSFKSELNTPTNKPEQSHTMMVPHVYINA